MLCGIRTWLVMDFVSSCISNHINAIFHLCFEHILTENSIQFYVHFGVRIFLEFFLLNSECNC